MTKKNNIQTTFTVLQYPKYIEIIFTVFQCPNYFIYNMKRKAFKIKTNQKGEFERPDVSGVSKSPSCGKFSTVSTQQIVDQLHSLNLADQ